MKIRTLALPLVFASLTASSLAQSTPKACLDHALDALFAQGNPQKAKGYLLDALKLDATYKPAMYDLGYLYAMEENIPEARKWLTKYIDAGGKPEQVAEAKKQLAELDHLEKIQADPKTRAERNYTVLILRASSFRAMGLPREAMAICAKAAKAEPNRYEAYALASAICRESGLIDDASRYLNRAVSVAPPAAQFSLDTEKYLIQDAADEQKMRQDVAISIRAGDFRQAETALRTLSSKHPDDRRIQIQLATVFAYSGQVPSARRILIPISDDAKDPASAKSAVALLAKLQDAEDYRSMLQDRSIRHPDLEEIESRMTQLATEIGVNAEDAQNLDQLAAQYDQKRLEALNTNDQGTAGVSAVAGLLSMIGAGNRKDEVKNKKDELRTLAGKRQKLSALPRSYVVGLAALDAGKLGVAELAFGGTPSRYRDAQFNLGYGKVKALKGDYKAAADLYGGAINETHRLSIPEKVEIAKILYSNQRGQSAGYLMMVNQEQLFDRGLPKGLRPAASSLCAYGIRGFLGASQMKEAEEFGSRAWRAFGDAPIGFAYADVLLSAKNAGKASQVLEDVYNDQTKAKAEPSILAKTEHAVARACLADKNPKKALKYAQLAQSHGLNDEKLMAEIGGAK